jgi:RNA polymerase sigma-70 factor (ECF subfamily)
VRRARDGEADAWETLYRHAYPRLYAYARRRLASPDEAEDAVSETMMRAFDRMTDFRWRDGGFDAWLFVICRNIVFEVNRKQGRPIPIAMPPSESLPEERVIEREEAARMRAAFARLSPEDREVLELRVIGDLGAKQAARILGKRAGAVRMAQSRALARLKAMVEEIVHAE